MRPRACRILRSSSTSSGFMPGSTRGTRAPGMLFRLDLLVVDDPRPFVAIALHHRGELLGGRWRGLSAGIDELLADVLVLQRLANGCVQLRERGRGGPAGRGPPTP